MNILMIFTNKAPVSCLCSYQVRFNRTRVNRPGSSRKIVIEIIVPMRDSSMYLPAVQDLPYLNINATILWQFCAIEILYDCYHVAWFSTIRLGLFFDVIGLRGGKLQRLADENSANRPRISTICRQNHRIFLLIIFTSF